MKLFLTLFLVIGSLLACNDDPTFRGQPTVESENAVKSTKDLEEESKSPAEPAEKEKEPPSESFALLEIDFAASGWSNKRQQVFLDRAYAEHDLVLIEDIQSKVKHVNQDTRPMMIDRFNQGHAGQVVTESFTQSFSGVIDLLIVIDNSSSMRQEQANLASKLQPLLSRIDFADWQIGVTTTDPGDPCMRDIIKKGEADISARFSRAIRAGINGSSDEMGIRRAVDGLKGTCLTQPWLRASSSLGVLIVSDEDNCSDRGKGCKKDPWASHQYLLDYMDTIRTVGKDARTYGIIWHPDTPSSGCRPAEKRGYEYSYAVEKSGGEWGSICDSDYSSTLSRISLDISRILKSEYQLEFTPETGSIEVYLDDVLQTEGYALQGKVIQFDEAPKEDEIIKFVYRYGATPIKKRFLLKEKAHSSGFVVYVDDVEQDSSKYHYLSGSQEIVFNQHPADNTAIRIHYKKYMRLKSKFMVAAAARNLVVIVGSQVSTSYQYDSARGDLEFNDPPEEGAALEFRYQTATAIYDYPFEPLYSTAEDLHILDQQGKVIQGWRQRPGSLQFDATEFVAGKQLRVRYLNIEERFDRDITLSGELIEDSLEVRLGSEKCAKDQLEVKQNKLQINCPLDTAKQLSVLYDSIDYWVDEVVVPDVGVESEQLKWSVFVNETPSNDFTRDGVKLQFHNLNWNDQVKIRIESL